MVLCGVQIFTESLTHTATEWTDTRHPRVALFTCYDTVNAMYAHPHTLSLCAIVTYVMTMHVVCAVSTDTTDE